MAGTMAADTFIAPNLRGRTGNKLVVPGQNEDLK